MGGDRALDRRQTPAALPPSDTEGGKRCAVHSDRKSGEAEASAAG